MQPTSAYSLSISVEIIFHKVSDILKKGRKEKNNRMELEYSVRCP